MKELSIEEKAKRYDEAISIAREYDFSLTGVCAGDVIQDIFPELKESEDEKMIQYFKDLAPFDKAEELYEKYGFSHKDALAWLEKRVEQKPTEWSEEDRKMMRNIIDDIHCGTNFNPKVMHAANERVKWFKYICMRYQSKWKPSEAQIKSLQESIGIVGELTPRGGLLKELVEQLEKLREE